MSLGWARARTSPDPSELLPLTERARYLGAMRLGLSAVAVAAGVLWPELVVAPLAWLVGATAVYLGLAIGPALAARLRRRIALPALQGGLLLDGLYLATVVGFTGGAVSPLRFLLYAHVVAVTLLCSYRTGLKLALWDTVLFLLVVEAIAADLVPQLGPAPDESVTAAVVLTVAAMWVLAIGTAAFSAANERQLRRQKVGLASLSAMVARMDELDAADRAEEIPRILLAALGSTFGFTRGVVLSSSDGGRLEVLTATDAGSPRAIPDGSDPAILRAWDERAPQLVRTLDASDPCLDALLPEARNVAVVPLFHAGGRHLGVVAMERGAEVGGMRRWEVDLTAQFAAHAALALSNAWLTDERERQLATIRGLEVRLRAHNADLEATVADRTEELRRTIADLEEIDRQRRGLLHHVVRAAEDERTRIAHDVHDDPVQKLIAVKMRLEMLGSAHPELAEVMEAQATVASTIDSMRRMLFDLSPPILDEAGIGPAVRYFLEHSPVTTEWSLDDQLRSQPSTQTRLILYRIAQEALTNARKHANAAKVKVTLEGRDDGVWMEIADDGDGFEPTAAVSTPGHLGLVAMRERAEMAGGWSLLQSLPGSGTVLQVWLPHVEGSAGGTGDELASVSESSTP